MPWESVLRTKASEHGVAGHSSLSDEVADVGSAWGFIVIIAQVFVICANTNINIYASRF